MWRKHKKRKIIRTIFFALLMVFIILVAYVVFFKLQLFKPKVSEEAMNQTSNIINEFDGVNIHTLDLDEIITLGESGIYALAEIYKNESSANQRWAIIMGLSAIGHDLNTTDKVLPYLEEALNDPDVNVRVTAASLVLSHGSTKGIPILIAELKNENVLKPSEPVIPIKSYCAETLIIYTGQDYGANKEQWQSWWNENKETLKI